MGPGATNKFGAPIFEPEVFRKQMYCIEESTCDIVGTLRRPPQWFGWHVVIRRPGNCATVSSHVTRLCVVKQPPLNRMTGAMKLQNKRDLSTSGSSWWNWPGGLRDLISGWTYGIVALAVFIISGVSNHSRSPNLIKLVIFSCPY